jgi:hypothetical protein
MSWVRQMKRKKQKEFAYEQYAENKRKEIHDKKRMQAIQLLNKQWKREADDIVPRWIQIISLFIPPKWYLTLVEKFIIKLTTWTDIIAKSVLHNRKMPYSRKQFIFFLIKTTFIITDLFLRKWLLSIRMFVRTFGLSTKITEHEGFRFTMVVKYWGKVVLDTEVTI